MSTALGQKKLLSWLWVVLCALSIFLIVPVARSIQRYVYAHWGRNVFLYFVLGVLACTLAVLIHFLIFKLRIRSLSNYLWLFAISGVYTYLTFQLRHIPEEAVHFLEYGLLGFFLFRALSHHVRDKSIYLTATFFALFIGTVDEILQWIMPQRYWDLRDTGLNALSVGLLQLAIWQVIRPGVISEKVTPKSLRWLSSTLVACLILLGLCVSNTPQRVAWYTQKIPWLAPLQKEEPMSEFGHKFHDPDIGIFYSRLSLKDLRETDRLKKDDYGHILNRSVHIAYERFLEEYNTMFHPFLYELRVHAFRRDTYYEKARLTGKLNEKKKFYFIAFKENAILERYFKQSLERSAYRWDEKKIQESEAFIDKSQPYESPVSAGLFTAFSEKAIWIAIAILISILVCVNLIWHLSVLPKPPR